MAGLFSKIIAGEIPCNKIAEDDRYFCFMDIRPIHRGHVLVIPKVEVDYIFDLDDEILDGMLTFAKPIAKAIEKVVPCERVGVIVAGLEVPHAHIHLVPFTEIGQLSFANAKPADPNELVELTEKIRTALETG